MALPSIAAAAAARALHLPPALTRTITVRRGIGLRSRDGVILRTDHYAPDLADAPTVLVRTPYGRTGVYPLAARLLAERGFHVVLSSCRGTGGSGGVFEPMRHERADGLDTVEWLRRQPWFDGRLGTYGPSYVGYTQWAIADVPELKAMATVITSSQFRDPTYSGDSYALFTTLAWASILHTQRGPLLPGMLEGWRGNPRLHRAFAELPLREADRAAIGAEVEFFRDWIGLAGAQPSAVHDYWADLSHDHRVAGVTAPVLMVGGWYDIFLPWQLRDYAALRAAGAQPQLTIGAWTHGSLGLLTESLRESVNWLRLHLRGEGEPREQPLRLYVEGAGQWRGYGQWPPPAASVPWYLGAGGALTPTRPSTAESPDRFGYDPADPTPSVGGPLLLANVSGPKDNSGLEARPDVLVYSSPVLGRAVDAVGPVAATVHVRASRPYFDVFVRLCDVDSAGRSVNVCDGLTRVGPDRYPADGHGVFSVPVELWPAGHRFRAGHRLRVQVSAGAHPRYARNSGTETPPASAVDLKPVEIEVFHDPDRPSAVVLSIVD